MAPIEAILVPIVRSNDRRAIECCERVATSLKAAGFRARVDTRDEQPGWKYSEWDMRGVPIRIEIGPRDVDAGTAVMARRDRAKGDPDQRESVPLDRIASVLRERLDDVQRSLYDQAKAFFELLRGRAGMVDIHWCERPECEAAVKAATGATTRIVREADSPAGVCTACGEPAKARAYFAQSY
jgi:prolyl-tRNA synthetase